MASEVGTAASGIPNYRGQSECIYAIESILLYSNCSPDRQFPPVTKQKQRLSRAPTIPISAAMASRFF